MNDKRRKNQLAHSGNAVRAMQMELAFAEEREVKPQCIFGKGPKRS